MDVINPATEAVYGRISLGSAADVDRAVAAAKRAFETFSRTTREERMALLQATLGVGLSNGWIVLLILPVLITVRVTAIRHEEAYLTQKFGQAYTDYRASVRRWL